MALRRRAARGRRPVENRGRKGVNQSINQRSSQSHTRARRSRSQYSYRGSEVGLHTILLSAILYGVWHTKGRSGGGGHILPNGRAIVLQRCGQCRRAGRRKGRLTRPQTTRSKTISCKGQQRGRGGVSPTPRTTVSVFVHIRSSVPLERIITNLNLSNSSSSNKSSSSRA